jgi:hypothetical protein
MVDPGEVLEGLSTRLPERGRIQTAPGDHESEPGQPPTAEIRAAFLIATISACAVGITIFFAAVVRPR